MFHSILVFADRLDRTDLFARNRDVDNRMIGAVLMAFAAADAGVVVDLRLSVLLETDRVFRTVHIATARHAAPAKVRDLVVHLHTG